MGYFIFAFLLILSAFIFSIMHFLTKQGKEKESPLEALMFDIAIKNKVSVKSISKKSSYNRENLIFNVVNCSPDKCLKMNEILSDEINKNPKMKYDFGSFKLTKDDLFTGKF